MSDHPDVDRLGERMCAPIHQKIFPQCELKPLFQKACVDLDGRLPIKKKTLGGRSALQTELENVQGFAQQ